jgi:hypothetical protein
MIIELRYDGRVEISDEYLYQAPDDPHRVGRQAVGMGRLWARIERDGYPVGWFPCSGMGKDKIVYDLSEGFLPLWMVAECWEAEARRRGWTGEK